MVVGQLTRPVNYAPSKGRAQGRASTLTVGVDELRRTPALLALHVYALVQAHVRLLAVHPDWTCAHILRALGARLLRSGLSCYFNANSRELRPNFSSSSCNQSLLMARTWLAAACLLAATALADEGKVDVKDEVPVRVPARAPLVNGVACRQHRGESWACRCFSRARRTGGHASSPSASSPRNGCLPAMSTALLGTALGLLQAERWTRR